MDLFVGAGRVPARFYASVYVAGGHKCELRSQWAAPTNKYIHLCIVMNNSKIVGKTVDYLT